MVIRNLVVVTVCYNDAYTSRLVFAEIGNRVILYAVVATIV